MPTNANFSGVSNCYVFKSQLQEYAQKAGLLTPVYETIKEGPSHEPSFSSTVTVNNVRYDLLPGFFNRKAAEHSAAEVALRELFKAGEINASIYQPVFLNYLVYGFLLQHETGLCTNLLQEYAQKMNYAMPVYQCQKDEAAGRLPHYSCTVEIGGIPYIGAAAKTKKEAEIKAARIALLDIQSTTSESSNHAFRNSQLMVIPCRKRATETASNPDETLKVPQAKKARFKKKLFKRKHFGENDGLPEDKTTGILVIGSDDLLKPEWVQTDSFTIPSSETLGTEGRGRPQDTKIESDSCKRVTSSADVALIHQVADNSKNGLITAADSIYSNHEARYMEHKHSIVYDDLTELVKLTDSNKIASMDDPTLGQV
ncbi:hypothetical protein V6N13_075831 [Hibiscus sabdariffa]